MKNTMNNTELSIREAISKIYINPHLNRYFIDNYEDEWAINWFNLEF